MIKKLFLSLVLVFGLTLAFSATPAHAQCGPDTIDCDEDPPVPGGGNGDGHDAVPIEMVSLCLTSVDPVSIDCNGFDGLIKLEVDLDETTPPPANQSPFLLEIEDVFTIRGRGTVPTNRADGR